MPTGCAWSAQPPQETADTPPAPDQNTAVSDLDTAPPLLLLDDIFGELDLARRNALLRHLPAAAQKIITTTHLDWVDGTIDGETFSLRGGNLEKP